MRFSLLQNIWMSSEFHDAKSQLISRRFLSLNVTDVKKEKDIKVAYSSFLKKKVLLKTQIDFLFSGFFLKYLFRLTRNEKCHKIVQHEFFIFLGHSFL